MKLRGALVAAVTCAAVGCGPHAFVRPAVPAAPTPDAAAIWRDASAECRATHAIQAAFGLTGRVREQRVPGLAGATLYVAASADGDIGLEARVSGQLMFKLGGTAARATLLLPADNRIVVAPADDIVDALVGLRIGPQRLLAILAGCLSRTEVARGGLRYGSVVAIETSDATIYLEQRRGVWTPRAGVVDALTVDYRRSDDGAVRDIAFRSEPSRQIGVSISLHVKDLERNPTLVPAMFSVVVPDDARPMSIDELRQSGLIDNERTAP